VPVKPVPQQAVFDFMKGESQFALPSVFSTTPKKAPPSTSASNLRMQSRLLEKKLEDFGVNGKVVAVTPGPVITTFEYEPAPGVKINRIVNLTDDLALALRAISIRIVAPIPGQGGHRRGNPQHRPRNGPLQGDGAFSLVRKVQEH
jgi:S-DNA-T family DNA segregation ATPase FtsK/SpoIIIE